MLLKAYCSSFSAVAACTFNSSMVDLIQDKYESLIAFKRDLFKKRETWKVYSESTQWSYT